MHKLIKNKMLHKLQKIFQQMEKLCRQL